MSIPNMWTIPEDTILTYFRMRHWDKLCAMQRADAPWTGMTTREMVDVRLAELLTKNALTALKQVGSTNNIKINYNNHIEVIIAALPKRAYKPTRFG